MVQPAPVDQAIILFDGHCALCNGSVRFIMKHDRAGRFRFASAQSAVGSTLAARHGFTGPTPGSMVLLEGDRCFTRTTASLRIARHLDGVWKLFYVLILIPRPLRDAVYRVIAANRRRWFGQTQQCTILPPSRQAEDPRA